MRKLSMWLIAAATTVLLLPTSGFTEDVEYDVCTCKHFQIGAQSTLRGGVCQRSEGGACLMQWGWSSKQKVPVGNGDSQEDAAIKAELLIKQVKADFNIQPQFYPPPTGAVSPLQIAIRNLSSTPWYDKEGMVESFLLAAGTALVRFDLPLKTLAAELLGEKRDRLVKALSDDGSFAVNSFGIHGRKGCLQIDALGNQVHVYIKTPFAKPESC